MQLKAWVGREHQRDRKAEAQPVCTARRVKLMAVLTTYGAQSVTMILCQQLHAAHDAATEESSGARSRIH